MSAESAFLGSFPRSRAYVRGDATRVVLREHPSGRPEQPPFSERHLQCVWFDPSLRPRKLKSHGNEEIEVIDPGRWNLEAGPDFLDATLLVRGENRRITGDIEVHIHPRDWVSHRHGGDKRYARVVAHVTYFPGSPGEDSVADGVLRIALKDALRADPAFSFESIDAAAYPYAAINLDPTPCAAATSRLDARGKRAVLDAAGEERLRRKTVRLAEAISELGPDQALYEETMSALGYKHNSMAFRRLARIVSHKALRHVAAEGVVRAYALLLGVSGLMTDKISKRWDAEARTFMRELWDYWWKTRSRWEKLEMNRGMWTLAGVRPQNHPVRRLAAAAALFGGGAETLASRIGGLCSDGLLLNCDDLPGLVKGGAEIRFWQTRLSLAGRPGTKPVALVGDMRAAASEKFHIRESNYRECGIAGRKSSSIATLAST